MSQLISECIRIVQEHPIMLNWVVAQVKGRGIAAAERQLESSPEGFALVDVYCSDYHLTMALESMGQLEREQLLRALSPDGCQTVTVKLENRLLVEARSRAQRQTLTLSEYFAKLIEEDIR